MGRKIIGECEECGQEFYSNGDDMGTPCKCGALMCEEHIKELSVAFRSTWDASMVKDALDKPKKTLIKVFEDYDLEDTWLCPYCYLIEIMDVLKKVDQTTRLKCFEEMLADPIFFEDDYLEQFLWPEEGTPVFNFKEDVVDQLAKKYKRFKYTPKSKK